MTDFNDLHQVAGLGEVARQLALAVEPQQNKQEAAGAVSDDVPAAKPLPAIRTGRELKALNIVLEWIVDGLIPKFAVCLLYGRGGIGKTTLMMMLADAVERGSTIFGMDTAKTQVIIVDFENSLAVLSERAKRTGVDGVMFIASDANPPPLDKPEWTIYLDLLAKYPGALFVFDTLRSSHSGDENDSKTMSVIMSRMRQLRDAGATVVLLHHTPKGNDRQFKGSGAIFDLCDQTLALYQTAKTGSEQEADDDDDSTDKVYRFGTGKKTRYKPHRTFLSFDAEQEVFVLAKNPDEEALSYLREIIISMNDVGCAKQTEIVKKATEDGGHDFGSDKKIISFLKKGVGRFWTADKGLHNSTIYRPIQFGSLADPIGVEKQPNWNNCTISATCKNGTESIPAKLENDSNPPIQSGNSTGKLTNNGVPLALDNTGFGRLADTPAKLEKLDEHTANPDDLPDFNLDDDDPPDFDLDDLEAPI